MGAGGAARGSNGSERLTLPNFLAFNHIQTREMRVPGLVIVTVIDDHAAAVAAIPPGVDDHSIRCGVYRRSLRRGNVDAGVHLALARKWVAANAITSHQTAVDRPGAGQNIYIAPREDVAFAAQVRSAQVVEFRESVPDG